MDTIEAQQERVQEFKRHVNDLMYELGCCIEVRDGEIHVADCIESFEYMEPLYE